MGAELELGGEEDTVLVPEDVGGADELITWLMLWLENELVGAAVEEAERRLWLEVVLQLVALSLEDP
jgi:hypothetical protein